MCDGTVDRVELLIADGVGQFHFVSDSARSGRGWLMEAYVGQGTTFLRLKLIKIYTQILLKFVHHAFPDTTSKNV